MHRWMYKYIIKIDLTSKPPLVVVLVTKKQIFWFLKKKKFSLGDLNLFTV